MIQWHSYIATD